MKIYPKLLVLALFGMLAFAANAQLNSTISQMESEIEELYPEGKRGKGSGYKQAMRALEFHKLHTDAQGKVKNSGVMNSIALEQFILENPNNPSMYPGISNAEWYSTGGDVVTYAGTGNRGGMGRVNCLAVDPNNANTFYAGTPAGGLWKTTDNMSSWTPLTDGMASAGVSGVVVDPFNSDRIFILTGDGDGAHSFCTGVFVSENGGLNWSATGFQFGEDQTVRGFALIMDPTDPDHMVAACSNGTYTTVDAWATFSYTSMNRCYDVEFKPNDAQTVYVASRNQVYISSDGGLTWPDQKVLFPYVASANQRMELAVTPSNPSFVAAVAGSRTQGFLGLFDSFNSGGTWNVRSSTGSAGQILLGSCQAQGCPFNPSTCQAWYDLALAVRPTGTRYCEVGAVTIWQHDDIQSAANSWDLLAYWDPLNMPSGTDFVHSDTHELIYVGNTLYACSDSGIFKSTDFGVTWTYESNGMRISQFHDIDTPFDDVSVTIGGAQDNGFNIIDSDNPATFLHTQGSDGMVVRYRSNNSSLVYSTAQNGNMRYSTDGGINFVDMADPPNGGVFRAEMETIANSPSFWIGGIDALYYYGGTSYNLFSSQIDTITHIAIHQGTQNVVYFTDGSSVRRNIVTYNSDFSVPTFVSGAWISSGLPNGPELTKLETNPANSQQLIVTYGGYSAGEKIYFSEDQGDSYQNISANLPNVPVLCAAFDPNDDRGIFIGTDIGVFYRNLDQGEWFLFNNGLPRVPIFDLDFVQDGSLKAATYGRSIWATSIPNSCPATIVLTPGNDPSNPLFTGIQSYQADNQVWSYRHITGGPGTNVRYQSTNYIRLTTGFEVDANCVFEAVIAPCGSTYEFEQ